MAPKKKGQGDVKSRTSVDLSQGTRVVLPPLPAQRSSTAPASVETPNATTATIPSSSTSAIPSTSTMISRSPSNLLDVFDAYASGYRNSVTGMRTVNASVSNETKSETTTAGGEKTKSEPDPIAFLNQHYNSEALLVSELPSLRDAITERMDKLDDRLATAVQRQSESSVVTQRRVEEAKASVSSLEERIKLVQTMASQSESTVREITKDMKRLDCAKRHLQRTITTLKRLHMLIHAVERLRLACITKPHPDYMSASQLVDATRLLLQFFDPHTDKVEAIRLLTQKVNDLQDELKYSLVRGFRLVAFSIEETVELEKKSKNKSYLAADLTTFLTTGEDDDGDEDDVDDNVGGGVGQDGTISDRKSSTALMTQKLSPDSMIGGIHLIDAIGIDARIEFMTGFIQDHLVEYSRIYKPVKEKEVKKETPRVSSFMAQPVDPKPKEDKKPEFALEFVEKRFLWLRNLLTDLQKTFPGVFPRYWNLEYHLTKNFLRRTRSHLLGLLSGATKDPDANNATVLLKALQKTIVFEKEVSAGLQAQFGVIFVNQNPDGDEKTKTTTPGTPKDTSRDQGGASKDQTPVDSLVGLASSAFDKHMRPYIALEEQSMDEQLVSALEDRTVDLRGNHPVLTSSTQMFVYIRGSITRCTALTKGNTFFLLYKSFQDCLRKYAQVLISKLPSSSTSQKTTGALMPPVPFGKQSIDSSSSTVVDSYIVPPGEEVTVCHVVGTAEYCAETVEALEELISDTIDEEFKSKIDMSDQQEAFHDITAKSIGVLVSGLENRLADSFKMMEMTNWGVFVEVGEESDYVGSMHKAIHPYVATARSLIPKSYFQSFCDKIASRITILYYESIIRLKIISEPGSQQLLLDVYNLKTLLLKLPVLEKASGTSHESKKNSAAGGTTIAPAMYTKMVQKQFKKIELLLKMCATPTNLLVTVFKDQWPGGSASDFQQVLSLKGMKRADQAAMLQTFGLDAKTARKGAASNVTSTRIMTERFQAVQDQASKVDMSQMRQKVSNFRNSFLQA